MKTETTDIILLLDRSGSMEQIRTDTIGGINKFIKEQQRVPGDCCLSLSQFDDRFEDVYQAKPIKDAPVLTEETFVPRGWTRLLDAIGRLITDTGERFNKMPEQERPGKVVFVIMTDGLENSSTEYNQRQIADMIKLQTDVYKWNFIFLGANQDAIATAAKMNIHANNAMSYAANAGGVGQSIGALSANTVSYRCATGNDTAKLSFSKAQRDEQKKQFK